MRDLTKSDKIRVLLIEDNPGDARLIKEALSEAGDMQFELEWIDRLTPGLERLATGEFDVILLDLNLPDRPFHGLETLREVRGKAPDMPIVVLTGLNDEKTGLGAIKAGAQDYLVKDQLNSELLLRTLRYAIERYHLHLERIKYERQQEQELNDFRKMTQTSTTITSRSFGLGPLKESQPTIFHEFVSSFETFLDKAIEKRVYQADHDLSTELRTMSEKLGFIKAGPRDVIDIFVTALDNKSKDANTEKIKAFMEEGRILVIQLMGHLISFYRNYYVQYQNISKSNTT
ncbi:response regulator [bacterium]|nr:response regulator [bacterium]MBU1064087.1 response regulator [bacterium]MBU1635548.1 response regulator [bacterium]MBU1874124.1 response regulator [bacterium]